MPAFGEGGGENTSLIEIVTTYRDEATAGMAATAKAATEMGATIQSASGVAEMSLEQFRALGGPEAMMGGRGVLPADFGVVAPEAPESVRALTDAIKELEPATTKTAAATGSLMSLWRLRVVARLATQVGDLGERLLSTAKAWVEYAARAEEADNAAANISMTHGELSTIMKEQQAVAAEMKAELGEGLLPVYKDSIGVVTSLQQTVADLSDGWQTSIGITMAMVGVFLKVAASVVAIGIAVMTVKVLIASLTPALLASATTWGIAGVAIGTVVVALGTFLALGSAVKSHLQEAADILGDFATKWELSGGEIAKLAQAYYDDLNLVQKAMFNLAGGMDAFIDRMQNSGSNLGAIFEQAAQSVESMILPAAQAFQSLADTQEDIQNEMLTKRREYAKVMADIDKYGYSEQRVAQADALNAQIRQLELADMQAVKAHEGQMGQIVSQTISAFERIGYITPGEAFEAQKEAAFKFGTATPETWEAGTAFLEEHFPGMMGAGQGAGQVIEGEFTVAKQIVALEDNTEAIEDLTAALNNVPAWGYGYLPLPGLKEWQERPVADELITQGVRTRP